MNSIPIYRMKGCPSYRGLIYDRGVLALLGVEKTSGILVIPEHLLEPDGTNMTREEALVHWSPQIREIGKNLFEEEK